MDSGIVTIRDLYNPETPDKLKTFDKVSHGLSWLQYHQLKASIPPVWKIFLKDEPSGEDKSPLLAELRKTNKISRTVYQSLIDIDTHLGKYLGRWSKKGFSPDFSEYKKAFFHLYQCTSITKLQDFQYRLLLDKIPVNVELHQWGIVDNPLCTFCNISEETMSHLFIECKFVARLWKDIKRIIHPIEINTQFENIVLNKVNEEHMVLNLLALIVKQLVYRKRCQKAKPNLQSLYYEIRMHYCISKYNAKRDRNIEKHNTFWNPVQKLFQEE